MTWINTTFAFDLRTKVFTIAKKEIMSLESEILDALRLHQDAPDLLADQLRVIVESFRPELAGAVVCGINYDLMMNRWEISVLHGSFPPVPIGQRPESVPLWNA